MSKRAFVLTPCSMDVSEASMYGDIKYVFAADESRPSIWRADFLHEVVRRLEHDKFDPREDFFVATGAFVPVVLVACELVARYGSLRCLVFNSVDCNYVERRIHHARDAKTTIS
jgi:hypothetical protein